MDAAFDGSTRIQAAKDSIGTMVAMDGIEDTVTKFGLITYSHYTNDGFGVEGVAAEFQDPPGLTDDYAAFITEIDSTATGGYGTPTGDALQIAKTTIEAVDDGTVEIVLILISDGEWNYGVDPVPVAAQIVLEHPNWYLYAIDINDGTPNPSNVDIGELGDGAFSVDTIAELTIALEQAADPCGFEKDQTSIDYSNNTLRERVHKHARSQEVWLELWYYREVWRLFPIQPDFSKENPVTISRTYRQPSEMTFSIPDNFGLLNRNNKNSPYNYRLDATTFDPIMNAKRKVRLRAGIRAYENLTSEITPTSTLAPTVGALASLTNGVLGDVAASATGYVTFEPADTDPFDITIDTGAVQLIQHFVIRFATANAFTFTLPAYVNWGWSSDNVTWHYAANPRPVGGDEGDYEDDGGVGGVTIEVARTDVEVYARYVRFRITPVIADQIIAIDELEVYGGELESAIGYNYFTGYIGGSTTPKPDGNVECTALDVLKKCIDNHSKRVTPQYGGQLGPVDAADIIHNLLTVSAMWPDSGTGYQAPFTTADIAWAFGSDYANFKYPVWQSQSNNIYGYIAEVLHSIGFDIQTDGDGVIDIFEPPYRQVIPDRVLIADIDGNNDCWGLTPHDDDVDLRNKVIVRSGDPKSGATSTVKIQPNSISQFGTLVAGIDDPIAFDEQTREKIAGYFIRDYAFRLATLTGTIKPDLDTRIKRVIAFRATRRQSMYTKGLDSVGDIRAQQLWIIDKIDEIIHVGDWIANIQCSQYVGLGPGAPTALTATPDVVLDTQINLLWDAPEDLDVTSYGVYLSSEGESSGFPDEPNFIVFSTNFGYGGLTLGEQYWFYVTSIGQNGQESIPSSVVTAVAGGAAGDDSNWTITDLDADFTQVRAPDDANGYYEYEALLTFTSPPTGADAFEQANYGFKHGEFRFAVGALPASPLLQDSWIYQDEWHGDRIPSLTTWDRVTVADMTWYVRFKSPTDLSGEEVFFRVWTWQTTEGRHGPAHPSNVASAVIP